MLSLVRSLVRRPGRALALLVLSAPLIPSVAAQPAVGWTSGSTADGRVGVVPGLPAIGLTGQVVGETFGRAVAVVGDINGDGHDDVLAGAPLSDAGGDNRGRAYLYLGGAPMSDQPHLVLAGTAAGDQFGFAVSGAGDVNGDGYDDVIVGAPYSDPAGVDSGRVFLYFGGPGMDAAPDVVLAGLASGDLFGLSVAGAGDVNGDGYDDVVAGSPGADNGGIDRGRAYVFFGSAAPDAVYDVLLRGVAAGDVFGLSVAGAGDVNGDGYDDVFAGAPGGDTSGADAGRATLYLGGMAMDATADLTLAGQAAGDAFGTSVAGAGDLDGDGYHDLAVGAPSHDGGGTNAGRAYLFRGGAVLDGAPDLTLSGTAPFDALGRSVAGIGDLDGDGHDDLAVGAPGHDGGGSDAGRAYVLLGGAVLGGVPAAGLSGLAGDQLGFALAGGGDIDGDGRDDVVAAAPGFGGSRGRALVAGVRAGAGADLPDEQFAGAGGADRFGWSVAGAGDVNGDGFEDLVAGAPYSDAGAPDAGRAYVYFGGPGADAVPDVTLTSTVIGERFGHAVAGAGDVNADGYDDVAVGAPESSVVVGGGGRVYVYFGGASMDSAADVTISGNAGGDALGSSVVGAGDVNADGFDDLVVGIPERDLPAADAGMAHVYFGGASMNAAPDVLLTVAAEVGGEMGRSVAAPGDVDGDGYADVAVGAPGMGDDAGLVAVFRGGAVMDGIADLTLTGSDTERFGASVGGAGDVNGDGSPDLVVGAPGLAPGLAGRAYVFAGAGMAPAALVATIPGAAGDVLGAAVAGVGDVNGDGYDDVAVGAPGGPTTPGRAALYFGGAVMDAAPDVTMSGRAPGDGFGSSLGRVRGRTSDVLVGAPLEDAGAVDAGRAYLYRSTFPPAAPRVTAVRDVPDDQGGFVTAEWTASAYDVRGGARVTEYVVERSRAGGTPAWETVAVVAATQRTRYSVVVPTYGVPAEGTSVPVAVQVTARTAHPDAYWRSGTETGRSTDNIAPPAPLAPAASPGASSVVVSWAAPEAPDLAGYAVYRSATSGFTPGDGTRVAAVGVVTEWTDTGAAPGEAWFYRVAARDANGNEGEASAEASTVVVAGEGADLPTAYALAGVSPNPVGVSAEVRFALPEAAWVSVAVVDVLGREVVRVTDGTRAAGWHTVRWVPDGLASGTYLLRLTAGSDDSSSRRFVATRSVTVVRR